MKPKILFMGTPEFAVPSLQGLLRHGYEVMGVVTQPDRPKGRGKQTAPPPVKTFALKHEIPVFQPERVRSADFLEFCGRLSPDLVVVVAFGQILPKELLEIPRLGCINVHPSLLPKYRGAAPLNWAIIRGETKTGVTIMQMDEGMDTGDMLLKQETQIGPGETFGELHDRLAVMGGQMLIRTIDNIEHGSVRRIPQDHTAATYAPRLRKEDGLIRWDANAREIVCLVRGLSPVPGAFAFLAGRTLRIFQAVALDEPAAAPHGTIFTTSETLLVAASDAFVCLLDVQLEGKKRMPTGDFLRGYRIGSGERFLITP